MKTHRFHIDSSSEDQGVIAQAAQLIQQGLLVAFPTETVYGLGGNGLSPESAAAIYAAKGRPSDNPLILHVASRDDVAHLATEIPPLAQELMQRFWPGPLTLVLKKQNMVPLESTGGLDTVAVRMPDHHVALALIKAAGVPLAAPSANLSGKPSPTLAEHVIEDLDGRIAGVIDAGMTRIGLESTVLDLAHGTPTILRQGGVTIEALRAVIPQVRLSEGSHDVHSPGTRYRHYSPKARVHLLSSDNRMVVIQNATSTGKKCGYIGSTPPEVDEIIFLPAIAEEYAHKIFAALRTLDEKGCELILVEPLERVGLGAAVMDRLERAASQDNSESCT